MEGADDYESLGGDAMNADNSVSPKPAGLSGWLVLVGVGLTITSGSLFYQILGTYLRMSLNGTWQALTTPGFAPYRPFWAPFIIAVITVNSLFLCASTGLLILFFRKSWRFPRLYIIFIASILACELAQALAIQLMLPNAPLFFDSASGKQLARTFMSAMIWIPYMLYSERVKNTFTRKRPDERT
jgi:hypothetical protein